MTYFETVIICRGMPSGLDQCDPINLCFGLEEALSCLFFPFVYEVREVFLVLVCCFFVPSPSPPHFLALRLETSRGVFGKYTRLGSAFPVSVCAERRLAGRHLYHGTAKSMLVCVWSVKLSGRGSGPGHGKMPQPISPVPF